MFGEFDGEPYSENGDLPKPWIKATSENGKWHFEDIGIHQVLSDDSDEVTFQIEISPRNTNSTALPKSIMPILLIRWKELNASPGGPILDRTDPIFFDSTIPIDFKR